MGSEHASISTAHDLRIPDGTEWEEAEDTTIAGIRRRRVQRLEAVRGTPLTLRERMLLKPASVPVSVEFGLLVAFILTAVFFVTFVYRDEPPEKRVLSLQELAVFDGERAPRIYLAILGQVFDVTRGRKHYGKGGGYGFFSGKDASKAFVTGDFEGDLVDDVSALSPEDLKSLVDWRSFYQSHKEYKYVGKLEGKFYTKEGLPTEELRRVERLAADVPEQHPKQINTANPPACSERWTPTEGEVWCKEGYPRQVFDTGSGKKPRCACFGSTMWSSQRRLYPNCGPDAQSCHLAAS
eukprot:jgi/Botrbrau1/11330/Bobra.0038s0089.1